MHARKLLCLVAVTGILAAAPADAGLLDWAKRTVRKAGDAVRKATKTVTNTAKKVGKAVTGVVNKVVNAAKKLANSLIKVGKKAVAFIKTGYNTAKQLWEQVKNLKFPLIKQWKTAHKRVDLSPQLRSMGIPVKDQGQTSTCMAQAMSTAFEYMLIKNLLKNKALGTKMGIKDAHGLTLSRRHIYYLSRHGMMICNDKTRMTGSWAAQASNWLAKDGTFRESLWPFQVWNPYDKGAYKSCLEAATNGNPPAAALKQRHFLIDKWNYLPGIPLPGKASVRRPTDIKGILAQGFPVVVTLFTFGGDQWHVDKKNPVVKLPRGFKLPDNAHYIALLGYDDAKKAFRFVNSWGESWGDKGYGWLPYDYVSRWAIEGLFVRTTKVH